jgi:hypothetical protein
MTLTWHQDKTSKITQRIDKDHDLGGHNDSRIEGV